MKKIKQRLSELYKQKELIEQEIKFLENKLKNSLSKDEKIELFYNLFIKDITSSISKNMVEEHLRGNISLKLFQDNKVRYIKVKISKNIDFKDFFVYYEKDDPFLYGWIFFDKFIDKNLIKEYFEIEEEINLPLQLKKRNNNNSVFVDSFGNVLDVWEVIKNIKFNSVLDIELFNTIKISKKIPLSYLRAKASFENPKRDMLKSLGKKLFGVEKVIKSYIEDKNYIYLPRGILDLVISYLKSQKIVYNIEDKRINQNIDIRDIKFNPKENQIEPINNILSFDNGIFVAPPGFGKTFIASYVISKRKVTTLIVVHKNMLLNQWQERLIEYFNYSKKDIGILGGGKNSLNFNLDIASIQSIKNNIDIIKRYSFLIVDECHHVPASSFSEIIKEFCGKYILGLSATPNRKDKMEPVLFHQIGSIRYEYKKEKTKDNKAYIYKTNLNYTADSFSEFMDLIINDYKRNYFIINILKNYLDRKVLILTDRIAHIENLEEILDKEGLNFVVLNGQISKKKQKEIFDTIENYDIVLATSSFIGEGIDFVHLDTIFFTTPISYEGRLIQYLGRIGRHSLNNNIAIDFIDNNPMSLSSFRKRKIGYLNMHYNIVFK